MMVLINGTGHTVICQNNLEIDNGEEINILSNFILSEVTINGKRYIANDKNFPEEGTIEFADVLIIRAENGEEILTYRMEN